jgi:hypothetical protein
VTAILVRLGGVQAAPPRVQVDRLSADQKCQIMSIDAIQA